MTGRLFQMSGVVIDLVHRVDHVPVAGEEVETPSMEVTAGGGFNAMVAARRMGLEVIYGGSLGTGLFAGIAERMIAAESLSIAPNARQPMDQGTCAVLVDSSGERSFISHHGAERHIDAASLDALVMANDDWVLLTGYSLFKAESAAVFVPWLGRMSRQACFMFDPGPTVAEIPEPALAAAMVRADWLSANRREAACLSGSDDAAKAAEILSRGRKGALVRHGVEGCWLSLAGAPAVHVPGFPVAAVDTNGAGDCHDGAFITASCLGFAPLAAARLANAAAAISTTRHGPATAPALSETLAFLQSRGIHLDDPRR